MENYSKTKTAWSPSFGTSTLGHTCANTRVFGAGVVAAQGGATTAHVAIALMKGDFPGSHAWSSPPTS